MSSTASFERHGVVPSYLLARLAESGRFPKAAAAARKTLTVGRPPFRARIDLSIDENGDLVAQLSDAPNRTISDAGNTQELPGAVVRTEDDAPVDDAAVNEAFDGLGATFEMLLSAFGRNSLDDAGAPLRWVAVMQGELGSILAGGVVRLRLRQSSGLSANPENSCVDFTANQSGGVSVVNTMENAQ